MLLISSNRLEWVDRTHDFKPIQILLSYTVRQIQYVQTEFDLDHNHMLNVRPNKYSLFFIENILYIYKAKKKNHIHTVYGN